MATFGQTALEPGTTGIEDFIRGSIFTCPEEGTADSIGAWLGVTNIAKDAKCAIYQQSDFSLVGVTDVVNVGLGAPQEVIFPFSAPKPALTNQVYLLAAWGELGAGDLHIYQDEVATIPNINHRQIIVYNGFPDPFVNAGLRDEVTCIYCTYTPSAAPQGNLSSKMMSLLSRKAELSTHSTLFKQKIGMI